jgi:AraC-like DNA-binding protein
MSGLNESRTSAAIRDHVAARAVISPAAGRHAGHGALVVIGLDAPITIVDDAGTTTARVVVAAPDVPFAIRGAGPALELLYDPERTPAATAVARRGLEPALAARIHAVAHHHRAAVTDPAVLLGVADEVAAARPAIAPRRIDRRVARALELMRDPRDRHGVEVGVDVSAAHLRALFDRDLGISPRGYQLWRRTLVGVAAFNRSNATAAAHEAGFADLAHFSRTCRRLLGAPPTALGRSLLA